MNSMEELLNEQIDIIISINQTLPKFKRLGPAERTSALTRKRIESFKEKVNYCRALDAAILTHADAETKKSHPYFVENLFKMAEECYEKTLDFMSKELETNSPSTSTGSSATTSYHKQQNVDDTTKSINKDGSKQDVSDKKHKRMNSAERLSKNAIGKQSCQTNTQTIHEANTQEGQDSASDDSLKRKQTNRIYTNPRKKVRFNGDYISRADFASDEVWESYTEMIKHKNSQIATIKRKLAEIDRLLWQVSSPE